MHRIFLFLLQHIESLLRLMPQDGLSDMEKVECDKCIWSLMSIEARGEPPVPSGHHKKGQKRYKSDILFVIQLMLISFQR
jgi:hypothetical protein